LDFEFVSDFEIRISDLNYDEPDCRGGDGSRLYLGRTHGCRGGTRNS